MVQGRGSHSARAHTPTKHDSLIPPLPLQWINRVQGLITVCKEKKKTVGLN